MGLRRLRGRLDQVQGEANLTLHMAQDLVADLADGFGVQVEIDTASLQSLITTLLTGGTLPGKVTFPLTIKIEPEVDA